MRFNSFSVCALLILIFVMTINAMNKPLEVENTGANICLMSQDILEKEVNGEGFTLQAFNETIIHKVIKVEDRTTSNPETIFHLSALLCSYLDSEGIGELLILSYLKNSYCDFVNSKTLQGQANAVLLKYPTARPC